MIKSNKPYTHVERATAITGTLQIEVVCWQTFKDFTIYNIEDYIIKEDGGKIMINNRQKRIEAIEINQFDQYLTTTGIDFSLIPKLQRDWLKVKMSLLPFIQNDLVEDGIHTIYNLLPENWVSTVE